MKKVLPVAKSPITNLLRWSYSLGITLNDEMAMDWFYSNFIQLYSYAEKYTSINHFFVDFWRGGGNELVGNNPFLIPRIIGYDNYSPLLSENSVIDFLLDAIDRNFYPVIFLDESKLEFAPSFGQGDKNDYIRLYGVFPHHLLINAYDKNREVFGCYGYGFGNEKIRYGDYGYHEVSFGQMKEAVSSMKMSIQKGLMHDQLSFLYQLKSNSSFPHEYNLNVALIKQSIEDYLNSENSLISCNVEISNFVFGQKIYDQLAEYFELCLSDELQSRRADSRHMQALLEHKRIMLDRAKHLMRLEKIQQNEETEEMLKIFELLVKEFELIKIKTARFEVAGRGTFVSAVKVDLQRLKEKEEKALRIFLKNLVVE